MYFKDPKVLLFKYFRADGVNREINNVNSKKVTRKGSMPAKILKWNLDIIALALTGSFNENIKNSTSLMS